MEITEVRVKLIEDSSERLRAFCSITFNDCFVIRDLKIIDGSNGPFVAMPSRKLTAHCPRCRCKNHVRAAYCNQCGAKLPEASLVRDEDGRAKLYADIAHPINSECREMIQKKVIEAYEAEKILAAEPNDVCRYDDFDYVYCPESKGSDPRTNPAPYVALPNDRKTPLTAESEKSSAETAKPIREEGFGAGIFNEAERNASNE